MELVRNSYASRAGRVGGGRAFAGKQTHNLPIKHVASFMYSSVYCSHPVRSAGYGRLARAEQQTSSAADQQHATGEQGDREQGNEETRGKTPTAALGSTAPAYVPSATGRVPAAPETARRTAPRTPTPARSTSGIAAHPGSRGPAVACLCRPC